MANQTTKNCRADHRRLSCFTNDPQLSRTRFSDSFFWYRKNTSCYRSVLIWSPSYHAQYIYRSEGSVSPFKRSSYGNGDVFFQETYQGGITYCDAYDYGRHSNFYGAYCRNNDYCSFNRSWWFREADFTRD